MVFNSSWKKYILIGYFSEYCFHFPLLMARILGELLSFSFPEAELEFKNSQDCKSERVPLFQAYIQFHYSSHGISGSILLKSLL